MLEEYSRRILGEFEKKLWENKEEIKACSKKTWEKLREIRGELKGSLKGTRWERNLKTATKKLKEISRKSQEEVKVELKENSRELKGYSRGYWREHSPCGKNKRRTRGEHTKNSRTNASGLMGENHEQHQKTRVSKLEGQIKDESDEGSSNRPQIHFRKTRGEVILDKLSRECIGELKGQSRGT
jgi:hypothetical protein